MTHKKFEIIKRKSIRLKKALDKIEKIKEKPFLTVWQTLILDRAKDGLEEIQNRTQDRLIKYLD